MRLGRIIEWRFVGGRRKVNRCQGETAAKQLIGIYSVLATVMAMAGLTEGLSSFLS